MFVGFHLDRIDAKKIAEIFAAVCVVGDVKHNNGEKNLQFLASSALSYN